MKLRNRHAEMEIGVVHILEGSKIEPGFYLYTQVKSICTLHFRIEREAGIRFLRTLLDWDHAGGNDGGIER